jgi:hypothetical protein
MRVFSNNQCERSPGGGSAHPASAALTSIGIAHPASVAMITSEALMIAVTWLPSLSPRS